MCVISPDDPPTNKPFFAREPPRHGEGVAVAHRAIVVDHGQVERAGQLVLPDAFDLVWRALDLVRPLASPELGEDRSLRIARDDLDASGSSPSGSGPRR